MPNIGALLKEEISRLSRKVVRGQVEATRKASAQHRRQIAALNRLVAQLVRRISLLERRVVAAPQAGASTAGEPKRLRFVAKGLRSHRERLGLSAADYGKLMGVSAQSVYNWEREQSSPRRSQLATLAALRGLGKREALARLEQLNAKPARKASKKTR